MVKTSRLRELRTGGEEGFFGSEILEVYRIGQAAGWGMGEGGHWSGKLVEGGPFFWTS